MTTNSQTWGRLDRAVSHHDKRVQRSSVFETNNFRTWTVTRATRMTLTRIFQGKMPYFLNLIQLGRKRRSRRDKAALERGGVPLLQCRRTCLASASKSTPSALSAAQIGPRRWVFLRMQQHSGTQGWRENSPGATRWQENATCHHQIPEVCPKLDG